jgi:hypothetical protein
MVCAFVEGRLSSGKHRYATVYSTRVRSSFRHHRDIDTILPSGEQTHSRPALFRIPTMFFQSEKRRNKSRESRVLLHANLHKTHWSSS